MRFVAVRRAVAATGLTVALACSGDQEPTQPGPRLQCIAIHGAGTIVGDRISLYGDVEFRIGNEDHEADVLLYLYDTFDHGEDGSFRIHLAHQIDWENGDWFTTHDHPLFKPLLKPNQYSYQSPMTIVAGDGMFANIVGEQGFYVNATIEFGPPAIPGGDTTAVEELAVGGNLCDG